MAKNKICGIYKITSPSGKVYIGQAIDIYSRWGRYKLLSGGLKKQIRLYNSLKKYGWINHVFEVVEECKEEDLNKLEAHYVIFFDTFNTAHGLNLRSGGNGGGRMSEETKEKLRIVSTGRKASEETRQKMSEARIGRTITEETRAKIMGSKNPNFGKKHTEEARRKMSEANRGEKNKNFGKHLPEETRKKMSLAQRGEKSHSFGKIPHNLGKPHSEEIKAKMRLAAVGKKLSPEHKRKIGLASKGSRNGNFGNRGVLNKNSKKVIQVSLDGLEIKTWDPIKDVERELGIISQSVSAVCRGVVNTAGGFKWKYYESANKPTV